MFEIEKASWHCKPKAYEINGKNIEIVTEPNTDFWQKTYVGYSANNAHALLVPVKELEFVFEVSVSFDYKELYDQAGIIIYHDENSWFKASSENLMTTQKIGSVLTTMGYSDWANSDIPSDTKNIHYKLTRKDSDFTLEYSLNQKDYFLIRMFHFFEGGEEISLGVYACSPKESSFMAKFYNIILIKEKEQ